MLVMAIGLSAQKSNLPLFEHREWFSHPVEKTLLIPLPFYDNVEDSAQSMEWWNSDPAWQIVTGDAYSGTKKWECSPSSVGVWDYLTLTYPIDGIGVINPQVSFWMKSNAFINNSSFRVQLSTNNGATWNTVGSNNIANHWHNVQINLASYGSNHFLIRIGIRISTSNIVVSIDDIIIADAPQLPTIALSQPTNNGMKLLWNQSGSNAFEKYRIAISTGTSSLYWDQPVGSSVSGRTETRIVDVFEKTTTELLFSDLTFTNTKYYARMWVIDTLGLVSPNSNTYDLNTAFNVTPQNAPFVQDFEGAFQWAADIPWAVTTNDASMPGHSPVHNLEDSPGTSNPPNADRWLVFQANCNSVSNPVLRFNHRYSFDQNTSDFGEIAYSSDNSNWTPIGWFSSYNYDVYRPEEFDIGALGNNSPVFIRFRTKSGSDIQFDGWNLDDVEIANRSIVHTFPFFDDVEDSLASVQNWIRGNWYITNTGYSGTRSWECKPILNSTYSYLTLAGNIDLTAANNPFLKLWTRQQNHSFHIRPEVSLDNGISWTPLSTQSVSSPSWSSYQWGLSDFIYPNVRIRIGVMKGHSTSTSVHCMIDDIQIENASFPGWITLTNATNNGMTALWQASTASNFNRYRLIISTSESNLNTWNQSVGTTVVGRTETRVIDITDKNITNRVFDDLVFTNMQYFARLYELNNSGLWNQGTNIVNQFTTFNVITEIAPFLQDFEGTHQWAADKPWAVTEADAGFPGHSQTHIYEDSPFGNYPPNANRWLIVKSDFSNVSQPVLRFRHRYDFDQATIDYGEVSYSTNNFTWTNIGQFTGNKSAAYTQAEFDLSPLQNQPSVFIRFRTVSGSTVQKDGWRLDDVEVYNNTKTTPFPFFDDAEDDSLSYSKWFPGRWETIIDGATGNKSWRSSPSGLGTEYFYMTLAGLLDISNSVNPQLSLLIRYGSGGGGVVPYSSIEISSDAGLSWNILEQGHPSASWGKKTYDISDFKSSNVLIRIGATTYNNVRPVLVDDILISEELIAPSLLLPNNAAANVSLPVNFTWNASPGAPKYQLQVATTNSFNAGEIVFDESTITSTSKSVAGLTSGNTYYWRVRAFNIINETGPWSEIWSFTTGFTTGDLINLNAGWNLISFDVTLNPNTPAHVFAPLISSGNLEMVTGYQGQQGKFFDPNGPSFLNTLLNLADGEGYWVKVQNAATLSKEGVSIPPGFSINLLNGWNLIAYWPQSTTTPAAAFAALISAGQLEMVTGYNQGGKYFDPNGPPFLNTLTEIKNGFGYWVKVSSHTSLIFPQ